MKSQNPNSIFLTDTRTHTQTHARTDEQAEIKCPHNFTKLGGGAYIHSFTFHCYSNVKHQISRNIQTANACLCNKQDIVWFCVCTSDNPLASSRTDAQTIQYNKLIGHLGFIQLLKNISKNFKNNTPILVWQVR